MLSEAEIIEAINSDSLISVSLGAGQPQKNVKMSTLASVAAELVGVNNGNIGVDSGASFKIGNAGSLIIVRDNYYKYQKLFLVTAKEIVELSSNQSGFVTLTLDGYTVNVKSTGGTYYCYCGCLSF